MRNKIFKAAFLLGITVTIFSCYKEYPPITNPFKPEEVSFNTHVVPILADKCATSECHDGTKHPDLRPENAYRELTMGGYYNTTFPGQSKIYKAIVEGVGGLEMPPDGPLSQLDKDLILAWIDKGAPND